MIAEHAGPLSRPLSLGRVGPGGIDVDVETSAEERAALARDLDCPAIHALHARFRVSESPDRIRVVGRVKARVERICVVTLEPFPAEVDESVEVEFAAPVPVRGAPAEPATEIEIRDDMPDELTGDMIDLGAITAEFLALGLDLYPRKPGVAFEPPPEDAASSPFAGLARLRSDDA